MLALPVHPRLARLFVAATQCGRLREGAAIAALLSEKDIRISPARGKPRSQTPGTHAKSAASDILDRLDLLDEALAARFAPSLRSRGIDPAAARQVARLRDDLLAHGRWKKPEVSSKADSAEDAELLKWILLAYPDRLVQRRQTPGTGVMVGGRGVCLAHESVVRDAELLVAIDAREDRRAGVLEAQVKLASMVRLEWIEELFPAHLRRERLTRYDESRRRVVSTIQLWYHDLLLREDIAAAAEVERTGSHLARGTSAAGRGLFREEPGGGPVARADRIREPYRAGTQLAEVRRGCAGRNLGVGLPGKITARRGRANRSRSVLAKPVECGPEPRAAWRARPRRSRCPARDRRGSTYEPGRPPILAVRLQELFGWLETPRVARGRVPILLHILGPNNRPVQITNDLKSFWTTTYHQVRKDLRRRYPKHSWPEDPSEGRPAGLPKRPKSSS